MASDYPPGFAFYAGPPPRRRVRWPWLVGISAAVVVIGVAIALVFVLDDGTDSKTGSPRAATTAYLDAARAVDRDAAHEVVCQRVWNEIKNDHTRPSIAHRIDTYRVGDAEVHGDEATVSARVTLRDGASGDIEFIVDKVDGRWLVCKATVH